MPILAYDARTGRVETVCGQGPMPRAATIAEFRDRGLDTVPGSGLLAACVPGAFGAWLRTLLRYGTMRLGDVLEPAIHYAEDGYPILPKAADMIDVMAPLFRTEWAESGRTYLSHGRAPAAGERVRSRPGRHVPPDRGGGDGGHRGPGRSDRGRRHRVLRGLRRRGRRRVRPPHPDDRRDRAAQRACSPAPTWRRGAPASRRRSPSSTGHLVHKPGPWSQAPVFLQQLSLLAGFDLAAMGFGSADHVHTVVEAAKLAFADREAWYGDPEHADVPMADLLDPAYAARRRALIGAEAAESLRPGAPGGRPPRLPVLADGEPAPAGEHEVLEQLADGIPAVVRRTQASGDTCFVSAVDRAGNMVVATPSGGWLKSSPVVPGLGFPLGTRGQMAWLSEGHPNALAPGKRPRTTLSPTLVLKDGRPYLGFGTPGGDQQDQWTLNAFLAHVDFGLGIQAAVEARAFHTGHVPASFLPHRRSPRGLVIERGCDDRVIGELRRRGHEVREAAPYSLGKVCMTGMRPDGTLLAAASPRGAQAYAVAR